MEFYEEYKDIVEEFIKESEISDRMYEVMFGKFAYNSKDPKTKKAFI